MQVFIIALVSHKMAVIVAAVNVLLTAAIIIKLDCFCRITITAVVATMFMGLTILHIQD